MRCLVTGATGFIGSRLVNKLLNQGNSVTVLVRSPNKLPEDIAKRVTIAVGEVSNRGSVGKAMQNCSFVYHLAGFAGIWSKDKSLPYKTNVEGTKNILDAALNLGIDKVVFTSSAGTLAPSTVMNQVDEYAPLPDSYLTGYERSKREAEDLCIEYCIKGLQTVIVNPTRVFGPGPLNKSNSVTTLIKKYVSGTWRFLPDDGQYFGNYVYIDDVVDGHIKAMNKGVSGEKYILGGENISLMGFFKLLAEVSGKNYALYNIPYPAMMAFAKSEQFLAEVLGKSPVITPPWAKRYSQHRLVSSNKAIEKLGYSVTPLADGIQKTLHWLNDQTE
jgi:nucleoside-diphosphate-sugar epimerase